MVSAAITTQNLDRSVICDDGGLQCATTIVARAKITNKKS